MPFGNAAPRIMSKEEAKQALNYREYTEWAVIQISTDQEKHGSHC